MKNRIGVLNLVWALIYILVKFLEYGIVLSCLVNLIFTALLVNLIIKIRKTIDYRAACLVFAQFTLLVMSMPYFSDSVRSLINFLSILILTSTFLFLWNVYKKSTEMKS